MFEYRRASHIDPHQSIMGARRLACWAGKLTGAVVAFRRLENWQLSDFIDVNRPARLANFHHTNRAIGATIGTRATANAREVVDSHRADVGIARDRPRRAADHAHRVDAMHARIGDHHLVVRWTLANEAWIVVVRCGTCSYAVIAARAALQINEHRLCAVQEAMICKEIEQAGI